MILGDLHETEEAANEDQVHEGCIYQDNGGFLCCRTLGFVDPSEQSIHSLSLPIVS
jgi:hypothetical protein